MFKQLIKSISYKIYLTGSIEAERLAKEFRISQLKERVSMEDYSFINHVATIENAQNAPSKITIGKQSRINGNLMLFKHGGEINIGDYSYVGEDTRIWSAKRIKIGDRVLIAHNVNIHDNISHPLNSNDRHHDYLHILEKGFQENNNLREEEIIISDDVWIGFNSIILKGVTIGKGAIIGANTLITEDVPPFAVIVGNPARIIKYVD